MKGCLLYLSPLALVEMLGVDDRWGTPMSLLSSRHYPSPRYFKTVVTTNDSLSTVQSTPMQWARAPGPNRLTIAHRCRLTQVDFPARYNPTTPSTIRAIESRNQSPTNVWESGLTNRLIGLPYSCLSWATANAALRIPVQPSIRPLHFACLLVAKNRLQPGMDGVGGRFLDP